MLGVDPEVGTSALRLWVTAGAAALLFLFCMLALFRPQASLPWRVGLVVLGAIFGAAIAWASVDHSTSGNSSPDRRALERRLDELGALALAPGSPLACLDALAGENVEAACEKALFVSPVSVAAASSYVGARLALLASMTAYAEHGGADIEPALVPLRRSLEADHFGFVAHVLTVRDGCTGQTCKALALLRDASRVRSNLGAQTLDRYLDHYQEVWAKAADAAPGEVAQAQPNAIATTQAGQYRFPVGRFDPAGQHYEPGADRAGAARRCRCRGRQSEPSSCRARVATLTQVGRKSAGANPCSTRSSGYWCGRANLAGAGAATSTRGRGAAWRAGSAQSVFAQRQHGRAGAVAMSQL